MKININVLRSICKPSNHGDKTKIIKFDRDHKKELEYTFIGLFPKNLSSIPVSYGTSDILKVNVAFEYERYIAGKSTSKSVATGTSGNRGSLNITENKDEQS